ncbi:hypothetical protein PMI06_008559 [Burkholderia sp. BT03]|nr:hypothetical protein PMI06_008559 [Burkholderia sp. BT03]
MPCRHYRDTTIFRRAESCRRDRSWETATKGRLKSGLRLWLEGEFIVATLPSASHATPVLQLQIGLRGVSAYRDAQISRPLHSHTSRILMNQITLSEWPVRSIENSRRRQWCDCDRRSTEMSVRATTRTWRVCCSAIRVDTTEAALGHLSVGAIAGFAFGSETLRQPSRRLSISVLHSSMCHVRLKRSREHADDATVQRKT